MTASLSNHYYLKLGPGLGYVKHGKKRSKRLMPLPTQIAGHGSEGDGQRAILKREADGKLLKPIQAPPKGPREVAFYTRINQSTDPIDVSLRQHIPKFYGVEKVGFTNGITVTEEYLVLEDITDGLIAPNVMDVKLGKVTWGPDASAKKIAQERSKYKETKDAFGFSVLGMLVHALDPEAEDQVIKFDKAFGKALKASDVAKVPEIFFSHGQGPPKELVDLVIQDMQSIRDVLVLQKKYRFFASSLLLVYDSSVVKQFKAGQVGFESLRKTVAVRLIDFAHAFEGNYVGKDENLLTGLESLLDLFVSYGQKL